jgi:TPR repeat protein
LVALIDKKGCFMSFVRLFVLLIMACYLSACATTAPKTTVSSGKPPVIISDTELGLKYLLGRGVVQDDQKAFYHFKRAADTGNAFAQNEVGYLYAAGKGVQKDYAIAITYYQQAAEQGLASAQYSLGFLYLHGLGVEANRDTAISWLNKAADHQFQPAILLLRQLGVRHR